MKFNKMKLAALAMAAVMGISTVATAVGAEELLSAGDDLAAVEDILDAGDESVEELPQIVEEVPVTETVDELTAESVEVPVAGEETTSTTGETVAENFGWVENVSFWQLVLKGQKYTVPAGKNGISGEVYGPYDTDKFLYFLYDPNKQVFAKQVVLADAVKEAGTEVTTPTCEHAAGYYMVATTTIAGKEVKDARSWVETKPKTGHKWVEEKRYYTTYPTCTEPGYADITYRCSVCKITKVEQNVKIDPLGHLWGNPSTKYTVDYVYNTATETYVSQAPTVTADRVVYADGTVYAKVVAEDGTVKYTVTYPDGKVADATADAMQVKIVNTVLDSDGNPVLFDILKDGWYAANIGQVCQRDPSHVKGEVVCYEILAQGMIQKKVVSQTGIATNLIGKYYDPADPAFFNDNIELANCTKAGSYVVRWYQGENKPINREETITVTPHHMLSRIQIEFDNLGKSSDGVDMSKYIANQFTVIYSTDGKSYTIKNNHCDSEFDYYEVVHCTAAGCPLKEAQEKYVLANQPTNAKALTYSYTNAQGTELKKAAGTVQTDAVPVPAPKNTYHVSEVTFATTPYTVNLYQNHISTHEYSRTKITQKPEGQHAINQIIKDAVDKKYAEKKLTYDDLLKAHEDSKENGKYYVIVSKNTATCTEPGKATVEYYCRLCNKYHLDAEYDLPALGHLAAEPVPVVLREATCQQEGLYDAVTYCARCGVELHRRPNLKMPRLKHSNEIFRPVYDANPLDPRNFVDDVNNVLKATPIVAIVNDVVVAANGMNGGDADRFVTYPKTRVSTSYGSGFPIGVGLTIESSQYTPTGVAGYNYGYIGIKAHEDINNSQDYFIAVRAYTDCEYCHNHKVDIAGKSKLEVTAMDDKAYSCYPGSLTVAGTFTDMNNKKYPTVTKDVAYFKSTTDYQARGEHKPGVPTKENVKEDGSYDLVTRCTICNTILDTQSYVVVPEDTTLIALDMDVKFGTTKKVSVATDSKGAITYESADPSIATVDASGNVTGVKVGRTTITVKVAAEGNYKAAETVISVFVYPTPTVVLNLRDEGAGTMYVKWRFIHDVDGVQFSWATDPEFTDARYSASTSNSQRRYNLEAATYYVRARSFVLDAGGQRIYSPWSGVKTVDVVKRLAGTSIVSAEAKGNNKVTVTWNESKNAEGYQIRYSATPDFKSVKTASYTATQCTRSYPAGTVYVQVRAYNTDSNGYKYYSSWSDAVSVSVE